MKKAMALLAKEIVAKEIVELVIIIERLKALISALPEIYHAEWAAKLPLCKTREELIALGTGAKALADALKGNAPA